MDRNPERLAKYLAETPAGQRGINLGCGGVVFPGWLNIDRDRPEAEISWDLTQGLPFLPDGQFDAVYSEHFLEHIPRKAASRLLGDCCRMLRPGGHIRLALPDLDECIRVYRAGDRHPDLNESFREEMGGVLHTSGELFNIAMRGWGHTYIYNREDIGLVLEAAGFSDIRSMPLGQSDVGMLRGRESRPAGQSSLIVEGRRPI